MLVFIFICCVSIDVVVNGKRRIAERSGNVRFQIVAEIRGIYDKAAFPLFLGDSERFLDQK